MIFRSHNKTRLFLVRFFSVLFIGGLFFVVFYLFGTANGLAVYCDDCQYANYVAKEIPPKNIAITFDDGPTPGVTNKILGTLDHHHTPATFFLIGKKMLKNPDRVQEIVGRGYVVGNHGFTHEHDSQDSKERLFWEMNNTNAIFEALTGRSTRLYRAPFLMDMRGTVRPLFRDSKALQWVREGGYIAVGADIDIRDYESSSAGEVAVRVKKMLKEREENPALSQNHVLLLHSTLQTAKALPLVLDLLETRGYTVVPLHDLLGLSKLEVMPFASETPTPLYSGFIVFFSWFWPFLLGGFLVVLLFTFLRPVIFLGIKYSIKEKYGQENAPLKQREEERVSVLIPAYNEEKNIRGTLVSILESTHLPDEILVLDDGSSDKTAARAREVAKYYPNRIRVISLSNGGKASALNAGASNATGGILVAIDGDTVLDRFAIQALLYRFRDPMVGAVAGKVVPIESGGIFEKLQYLEYLVGQNIDKAALSRFGAVNVVPGAIGAWRRELLLELGGYSKDTLVEDQDLTLGVLARGMKVVYEPAAISYTEVPAGFKAFFLQRLRWMYGTFQCVWKYRKNLFSFQNKRLGLVALPYAFSVNVLFPVVVAVLHGVLLLALLLSLAYPILWFFLLYTVFDIFYAFLALAEEEKKNWRYVVYIPLQRLLFMVMYAALTVLVVLKVLDGSGTTWKKLLRKGLAEKFYVKRDNAEITT